ncbi:MAG: cell division protein SepF [Candidatus Gastranaerophilales bacterium]|nr:cell division protein SepF [Candidatus Gastranaerophilales bacterium]
MTIGEKVSGLVGWITDSLTGGGDYDDGALSDFDDGYSYDGSAVRKPKYSTRISDDETANVVRHPNYKGHEVRIIEPRSFGDTAQIVKQLLDQKTVVLNLHLLDKEQSQRTIDFVCGAAFALGGAPQKVGDTVFVFTPNSVQLSVESKEQNAFGTESLWGANLC